MCRLLVVFCLIVAPVAAHVCLITPQQRGKFDISTSGNRACFKHGFPCGGDAPFLPTYVVQAGQPAFIKWQQNYNHYEVGFPGYMDISYGPISSTSESQWTVLAVVSDQYVYSQDHQQNYTAIVNIPNKTCDHCVIRVRYNPHKSGEATFYQCSDVSVMRSAGGQAPPMHLPLTDAKDKYLQRAAHLTQAMSKPSNAAAGSFYGEAYDPFNPVRVTYVGIDPVTGVKTSIKKMDFGLDSGFTKYGDAGMSKYGAGQSQNGAAQSKYIADAVASVDPDRQTTVFMYHSSGTPDNVPDQVLEVGLYNGSIIGQKAIVPVLNSTAAINALVYASSGRHFSFSIEDAGFPQGSYYFVVGSLDYTGSWKELARTSLTENLYVNYQWMVHDPTKNLLYILLGNENAADALNARIYTFSTAPGAEKYVGNVELDVSYFTFMSFHLYQKTGQLFAISPGLFTKTYPGYSLVEIDLVKGGVRQFMKITPPGIFEKYYGGSIFNGVDQQQGVIKHMFRVADTQADVIASISLVNQTVTFSQLTNLRHIHNLVYSPAMP